MWICAMPDMVRVDAAGEHFAALPGAKGFRTLSAVM
jgi:hypothetical protein